MNLMEWEVGIPGKVGVSAYLFSVKIASNVALILPIDSMGRWIVPIIHDIPRWSEAHLLRVAHI